MFKYGEKTRHHLLVFKYDEKTRNHLIVFESVGKARKRRFFFFFFNTSTSSVFTISPVSKITLNFHTLLHTHTHTKSNFCLSFIYAVKILFMLQFTIYICCYLIMCIPTPLLFTVAHLRNLACRMSALYLMPMAFTSNKFKLSRRIVFMKLINQQVLYFIKINKYKLKLI